jgi:spermidine synthase
MIPWVKLATTLAPGGTELSLWQRGADLVVRAGALELMSNRAHASEEQLAEHGCAGLGPGARVLVGGLGMGFTLRAVLAMLPATARVTVAELVPAIVDWVRGPIGGAALLDDPRVTVEIGDCGALLRRSEARFDAVLLDVDNGPRALTERGNRRLYGGEGLAATARALAPGGRLAVWSAGEDAAFARRMEQVGFAVRVIGVRERRGEEGTRGKGARHVVFVGVRRGG